MVLEIVKQIVVSRLFKLFLGRNWLIKCNEFNWLQKNVPLSWYSNSFLVCLWTEMWIETLTNHVSSCYWESLQWEKVEMHVVMWIILLKDAFHIFKSDCFSIDFLFKSYLDSIFSIWDFTSLSKGLIKTIEVLMILSCHALAVQALSSCQTILPF